MNFYNLFCVNIESTSAYNIFFIIYWQKQMSFGKEEHPEAVFINLFKTFDKINYKLLITKLPAYVFSKNALKLFLSYISYR